MVFSRISLAGQVPRGSAKVPRRGWSPPVLTTEGSAGFRKVPLRFPFRFPLGFPEGSARFREGSAKVPRGSAKVPRIFLDFS